MKQAVLNLKPNLAVVELRVPDLKNLTEGLAYESDVLLGYTGLRKELGLAGRLGLLLVELEIKPFDDDQVEAYKEQAEASKIEEIQATLDKRALDPFLVAVLGEERYTTSVWDEPDFEEEQYSKD